MGVIDEYGQWEHCNGCGKWVLLENLGYLKPNEHHTCGLDLCVDCVDIAIQIEMVPFDAIIPAKSWVVTSAE